MFSIFVSTVWFGLGIVWDFLSTWWWLFLPFLMVKPVTSLWRFWRMEVYDATNLKPIMWEVRIPSSEITRPFKAMESVFMGFWQVYDPPNPREKWIEGQSTPSVCIEMVSVEGEIRFYLRGAKKDRRTLESAVYSQFPEAELIEIEDYTNSLPSTIPNKEWELYGTDFKFRKNAVYPLRTYVQFFEPTPESKEEQRVDPMGTLLEGLSKMGPGEHMWIQLVLEPITVNEHDFVSEAEGIVNKLVKRPEDAKAPSTASDMEAVFSQLATGKEPVRVEEKPREFSYPEMQLTAGERNIVRGVEEKVSKHMFKATLRFLYIAKREKFFSPSKALPMSYYNQFSTENMNGLMPDARTGTKVKTFKAWFIDRRRMFHKKRHILRQYKMRVPYDFPKGGHPLLLNTEELASLFHFPGKQIAPGAAIERIQSKKGEAPPEIPTE
ncbi:hypothetical protein KKI17_01435 [Patescibacteria group bacterium]|nr:hypothetical protein [Patescibacteria group bacterium]